MKVWIENKTKSQLPALRKKKERLEKYAPYREKASRKLKKVMNKIADIESRNQMILTRHFIERWCLRVSPADTEEVIISKLKEARIDEFMRVLGSGSYPYQEKYYIIITDWVLTTVICPNCGDAREPSIGQVAKEILAGSRHTGPEEDEAIEKAFQASIKKTPTRPNRK